MPDAPIPKVNLGGRNKYVYVGGGLISAGILVYFWRKNKAANAAVPVDTTATDTSSYDTSQDTGYGTDTGDYSAITEAPVGVTPGNYYPGTMTATTTTNNATWTQAAVGQLSSYGYDSSAVVAALGKYFAGDGLTDSEYAIVQAAIAAEGYPPNQPPAPHLATNTGQSDTSGNNPVTGGQETTPTPTPTPAPKPAATPKPPAPSVTHSGITLNWNVTPNTQHFVIHHIGGGTATTTDHHYNVQNPPGKYYVTAVGPGGESGHSNTVTVTSSDVKSTKKA